MFQNLPLAKYRVAVIATPQRVLIPGADVAARRMRFDRYFDLGWLDVQAKDPDGGEHDEYDRHSIHLGVFRKDKSKPDNGTLVATSRLILGDRAQLPTKQFFPNQFASLVPERTVEISRLVATSKCRKERHLCALAQFRTMYLLSTSLGYRDYICLLHPRYLAALQRVGVPARQLAEAENIPEYGDSENVPALIRGPQFAHAGKILGGTGSLFFRTFMSAARKSLGCGYYARGMVVRVG